MTVTHDLICAMFFWHAGEEIVGRRGKRSMDLGVLKALGQIAGIGGIAIGAFLILGRNIVAKNIFPSLTRQQSTRIILVVAFMAWTIALAGIGAWTFVATHPQPASAQQSTTVRQAQSVPAIPGDTGWIFAGYFDNQREVFTEGPYVSVVHTSTRGMRRYVQTGDTIRLNVSRNVYIVDFKRTGASQKLVSPITKGTINQFDETGVTLPRDAELIARDVSEGHWPGNNQSALPAPGRTRSRIKVLAASEPSARSFRRDHLPTGSIGASTPRRSSIAWAAVRHRSSR